MATRTVKYRQGNCEVELTGDLLAMADEVLGGLAGKVTNRFEATFDGIVEQAQQTWPVRTGRSRDAFRVEHRLDPDGVETVLLNDARNRGAPYVYMTKWSRYTLAELRQASHTAKQARFLKDKFGGAPTDWHTMRSPWAETIRKPTTKAEAQLAEELEDDLLKLLDGGA